MEHNVHYSVHKYLPLMRTLRHIFTLNTLQSCLVMLVCSSHLRLGLPNALFPSDLPTKTMFEFLSCPMYATCPDHTIRLDVTVPLICGTECTSHESSRSALHPSPNLAPQKAFSLCSRNVTDQVSHP